MRVAVWGDSIVYGAGDQDGLGWVGRLRKAFFDPEDGGESVYNRGINGDTTADLLARFPAEIATLQPSHVLIGIGINDTVHNLGDAATPRISLREFVENVSSLLAVAKDSGAHVIVIGMTNVVDSLLQPFPWSTTGKCYSDAVVKKYDEELERIARDMDLQFVKMHGLLLSDELFDGLHPNAAGYEKMARTILPIIK